MLKECRTHGYFRAEECPICGEQGRFLMNDEELDKLGRTMAGVLRHFPERYNLRMNKQGWVDLDDFINEVRHKQRRFRWLKPHHILAIIDTDPKGRYQFRDGLIRATYAHSVDVELDLPTRGVPEHLYYPATKEEKDARLVHLRDFHARHADRCPEALERLKRVARTGGNLFAELLETVRYCSLGQITHALYEVGGQYRRNM